MAKPKECQHYDQCGFVTWRKKNPSFATPELPADGDCAVPFDSCPRANPFITSIDITDPTPATDTEINIAFPILYVNERGQKRRVFGGHQ